MDEAGRVRVPLRERADREARRRLRGVRPLRDLVIRWRHREIAAEDVFLVGYPKSGNTWLAAMVSHLATGTEFSFDTHNELAAGVGDHRHRRPILPDGGRLIRSHEPYAPGYGDKYRRVLYVVRDPRDVVVSYYHHHRRLGKDPGSIDQFLGRFLAGSLDGWGTWPAHIRSWLDSPQARDGRLIVVRYEDLLADPEEQLAGVARFLELPATPSAIRESVALHTADRMRASERTTEQYRKQARRDVLFIRRASSGEHAEVMTGEQLGRFGNVAGAELARLGYQVDAAPRVVPDSGSSRS
jgi:Sulfotransferase domain